MYKNYSIILLMLVFMFSSLFSVDLEAKSKKKKKKKFDFMYAVNKVVNKTKSAVLQTNAAADNILNDVCVGFKKKLTNKKSQTWVKGHYKHKGYNKTWCKGHWRKTKKTLSNNNQGPSQE
ncbi:hypothetical protein KAJ27_25240 [bacterium]|nr:hypothetical protein [bacterium]